MIDRRWSQFYDFNNSIFTRQIVLAKFIQIYLPVASKERSMDFGKGLTSLINMCKIQLNFHSEMRLRS